MPKTKSENAVQPATGFANSNELLELYFAGEGHERWGSISGKSIKGHLKAAARAAADSFARTRGAERHRDVFHSQLQGAGIHLAVAHDVAYNSKV